MLLNTTVLSEDTGDDELALKRKEYMQYIDDHIENVHRAFDDYGEILSKATGINIDDLKENVNVHDKSKYTESEFEGYRQWFYPVSEEKTNRVIFDKAWIHHLRFNKHHPEFWAYADNDNKVICTPMEPLYIVEMLLDWIAMGYSGKSNTKDFWSKNRDRKPINMDTVKEIDRLVDLL